MRQTLPVFAASVVLLVAFLYTGLHETDSVPVPEVQAPKQSHHVVHYWVCEVFVGLLITTDPPIWLGLDKGMPNDENVALIVAANLDDHVLHVTLWRRDCPLKPSTKPTYKT